MKSVREWSAGAFIRWDARMQAARPTSQSDRGEPLLLAATVLPRTRTTVVSWLFRSPAGPFMRRTTPDLPGRRVI